jgi:hypothetical protein
MNAQQVWQAQAIDTPRVSLEYVRHAAGDFDRRRRWRALPGAVAVLGVCALYAHMAWQVVHTKPLLTAGSVCMVAGMLYCIYRLYRCVAAESSPVDAGVLDTLRYQRRQLERQRDWRRNSGRRTILAILPGYSLLMASLYFETDPVPWRSLATSIVLLALAIVLTVVTGEWKARQTQREIDALDSLASDL